MTVALINNYYLIAKNLIWNIIIICFKDEKKVLLKLKKFIILMVTIIFFLKLFQYCGYKTKAIALENI